MRQYDVMRTRTGQLVILLQSELLSRLSTRLVAPLLPTAAVEAIPRLHPKIRVNGADYLAMIELMSPLRVADLRDVAGSARDLDYEIKRAYDIVLSGV